MAVEVWTCPDADLSLSSGDALALNAPFGDDPEARALTPLTRADATALRDGLDEWLRGPGSPG